MYILLFVFLFNIIFIIGYYIYYLLFYFSHFSLLIHSYSAKLSYKAWSRTQNSNSGFWGDFYSYVFSPWENHKIKGQTFYHPVFPAELCLYCLQKLIWTDWRKHRVNPWHFCDGRSCRDTSQHPCVEQSRGQGSLGSRRAVLPRWMSFSVLWIWVSVLWVCISLFWICCCTLNPSGSQSPAMGKPQSKAPVLPVQPQIPAGASLWNEIVVYNSCPQLKVFLPGSIW